MKVRGSGVGMEGISDGGSEGSVSWTMVSLGSHESVGVSVRGCKVGKGEGVDVGLPSVGLMRTGVSIVASGIGADGERNAAEVGCDEEVGE